MLGSILISFSKLVSRFFGWSFILLGFGRFVFMFRLCVSRKSLVVPIICCLVMLVLKSSVLVMG